MKLPGIAAQVLSLIRHAAAGIQGREGMATGFRRYDGTIVRIRCSQHTCMYFRWSTQRYFIS